MNGFACRAAILLALAHCVAGHANETLNVTWTPEVGSAVRFLNVEVGPPAAGKRVVSLSYQVLRPCKQLSLAGHNVGKDGTRLAKFSLASGRSNAGVDQKFRDTVTVDYTEGHYLVVDDVSCL